MSYKVRCEWMPDGSKSYGDGVIFSKLTFDTAEEAERHYPGNCPGTHTVVTWPLPSEQPSSPAQPPSEALLPS